MTLACDGREAVELWRQGTFDLILMDVEMPVLDGLEACKQIRAQPSAIPIIAVTARAIKGDRERCLAAGMDGYVTKPVGYECA